VAGAARGVCRLPAAGIFQLSPAARRPAAARPRCSSVAMWGSVSWG